MSIINTFIPSPLNYTGNKYRILPQILPHFPTSIGTMVDLFCGGATVGINTNCKKAICIDSNPYVIHLLQYLAKCQFDTLINQLEQLIAYYHLSYSAQNTYAYYYQQQFDTTNHNNGLKEYNQQGFYTLRTDYNALTDKTSEKANLLFYLLIVYGFNNDIRFSRNGYYNLPVGKTDLNRNNIKKLRQYIERIHTIQTDFIVGDFRERQIEDIILSANFVYADPPYLISDAVYNETSKWNIQTEQNLLCLLDRLILQHTPFALSNILEKGEQKNLPLMNWLNEHKNLQLIDIDYHYRGAYYNKKERSGEREILILSKYEQSEN